MNIQSLQISESMDVLNENMLQIAQVREWADFMGYKNPKKFSRKFLQYYDVRPCKMLIMMRLKSIYQELKAHKYSNFYIARRHGLPDEKALNKFVNYHLGCCPRRLKAMAEKEFNHDLEKFRSNFR